MTDARVSLLKFGRKRPPDPGDLQSGRRHWLAFVATKNVVAVWTEKKQIAEKIPKWNRRYDFEIWAGP
jgi:hypothetical protein